MKIFLDDTTYLLDVGKLCRQLRLIYAAKSVDKIKLGGKTLDMSKRSLLRTALKSVMVPIVLPILEELYLSKGFMLPKPERHSDLIDYAITHIINFASLVEKDFNIHVESTEIDSGNGTRIIKSLLATSNTTDTGRTASKT